MHDTHDLTGFQRDLLRRLAVLGETHGLGLMDALETEDGYRDINHGRLYPNLDKLVAMGLVEKGSYDDRTNSYRLSRRGKREVEETAKEWGRAAAQVNGLETPVRGS